MFPLVKEMVASVMPVEKIRYVAFSHVEADECGSLNEWLAVAPQAEPVCSVVAAMVSVQDIADRPPRALADGEVLSARISFFTMARHSTSTSRLGLWLSFRANYKDAIVW